MSERRYKVLILDHDPDVLTRLQQVLEDAGVDTTITWDDCEARELAQNTPYDVILVGERPPEVAAETFLYAFNPSPTPRACLLLGASESRAEPWHRLGIAGVVPRRDPFRVLQAVREQCHSKEIGAKPAAAA